MDVNLTELFPLTRMMHQDDTLGAVALSTKVSVADYLSAFLPDPDWVTPQEVEGTPYCYTLTVDGDSMVLLDVNCTVVSCWVDADVPDYIPVGFVPKIEIKFVRRGWTMFTTSYWMPERVPC